METVKVVVASLLFAGLLSVPADADTIYVSDVSKGLYAFDTVTKTFSFIGTTAFQMPDIALDSSGTLLGAAGAGNTLYEINTGNASVSLRGLIPGRNLNSLAFDASDVLFGADQNGGLYDVNPGTGIASLIGPTLGYLPAGDLAFDQSGALFMSTTTNRLVRLDPTSGATTLIGIMGAVSVYGLAFDSSGTLWGFTRPGLVYTINTTTGLATFDQDSGILAFGAASDPSGSGGGPVPEPGTWVLMGGALLWWVVARRRRRAVDSGA